MANGRNGLRNSGRGARPSGPAAYSKDTIGISLESNVAEALAALERGILEKVIRSGARAGALVFYNEMRQRVAVRSGQLYDSIYHFHDDKQSSQSRQTYFIGPNKSKAPHWHQVEFGHWRVNVILRKPDGTFQATKKRLPAPIWVAPKAFVRPTWEAKKATAINAVKLRMTERMKELMSEINS